MLRSRCVSEGVRTVFPAATGAMYCVEEARDMADDVAPAQPAPTPPSLEALCEQLAADVAISTDLDATCAQHQATFDRMATERPEWIQPMQDLFFERDKELKNTAPSGMTAGQTALTN
jgi:hypothetical protein